MKSNNRLITLGLIVMALFVAFITIFWKGSPNGAQRNDSVPPLVSNATPEQTPLDTNAAKTERMAKLKSILKTSNVPIVFWGKVQDELGAAISGATIRFHIRGSGILNAMGLLEEDVSNGKVMSAGNGTFSISPRPGMALTIESITKPGYKLLENQKLNFSYTVTSSLHKPDEKKPLIYAMQREDARDEISTWQKKAKLPWNEGDLRIDLSNGELSPTGNLILTPARSGSVGRFDWSLSIRVDGGELVEAEPNTAPIAPVAGYTSKIDWKFAAADKDFVSGLDTAVYYRIKGKYGRLQLLVYADVEPDSYSLHLDSSANTSGGRTMQKK